MTTARQAVAKPGSSGPGAGGTPAEDGGSTVNQRRQLHVVIPVFNESGNVVRLVRSLATVQDRLATAYVLRPLFVDDGSTDGTADLLAGLPSPLSITVLRGSTNRGPGDAFARGFAALHRRLAAGDVVATMEGDNTSRPELLAQMLVRMREGFAAVLASPYLYGGGMQTNLYRTLLSHGANSFLKEALGLRGIMTMSSFFRVHAAAAITRLQACFGPRIVETCGFECMVEMLLKMAYMRMTLSEVAMVLDGSLRVGTSKMKVGRTILGYLGLWLRSGRWRRRARRFLHLVAPEPSPTMGDGSPLPPEVPREKPAGAGRDGAQAPARRREIPISRGATGSTA